MFIQTHADPSSTNNSENLKISKTSEQNKMNDEYDVISPTHLCDNDVDTTLYFSTDNMRSFRDFA